MGSSVSGAINSYAGIEKYSPDFQLLGQVMNSKQTQLNSNRGKLQDYRNQLGALDVAKDEDRAYLDQRLDQVSDITNKYANLDLSSDALTNSLIGNMGQVFDQNVTAALTGTKILRNEQAEWTKAREKGDGKYSDANYAYAMRQANQWLNDGATGTRYNGGGGFIEYASPTEHINKVMPELLKAATHKRQRPIDGPAGGVGGIITEEYVDRNELQSMIQSQLGEKHLRQMQIDAWANYDQLPDNILEQDYNNFTEPKIQENEDKIKSLEAAIANATNPDVKKQYQDSLDYAKKEKDSFENENSFSSLMASRGKRDVYTTLHQAKLMDGFLDAYSREPLVVDIAVNAIDQANRTLEHQNEVMAETLRHNKATEAKADAANKIAAYKAGINADGTVPEAATFLPGPSVKVPTNKEENSVFTDLKNDANALQQKAISSLKAMGVSDKTAKYFVTTKRFADMTVNGNLAGVKFLELDGKKLEVSKDFRNAVTHLGSDHFNNPILKQSYKEIDEMVTDVQGTLAKAVLNKQLDLTSIPNFTVKLNVKDAKAGTYTVISEPNGFKGNPYVDLLKKKASLKKGQSLSNQDAANLQLYGNMHLMNDGGLSPEQRAFARQRVVEQLNGLGISNSDYKKIQIKSKIKPGEVIPNTKTKVEYGKDSWMTEITKRNTSSGGKMGEDYILRGRLEEYSNMLENEKEYWFGKDQTKIKALEAEVAKIEKQLESEDVSDRVINGFKTIEENIAKTITSQTKLVAGREQVLPRKGNEGVYIKLAAASGLVTTSKDDLVLVPTFDDKGKTTTIVKVKNLTTGAIGKNTVKLDQAMTADELEKLNISKWDVKGHRYNAEKGDTAPVLKLGNGNYNGIYDRGMNSTTKASLIKDIEGLPEQVLVVTQKLLKEYSAGLYEVRYVSVGKKYRPAVFNTQTKENLFMGEPLSSPIIEDSKADEYLESPKSTVDSVIEDMIIATQKATYNNL